MGDRIDVSETWPAHMRAWVRAHEPILDATVEHLRTTGCWPLVSEVQRAMMKAIDPPPMVADAMAIMPRPLGDVHPPNQRIVLTLFGVSCTDRGRALLIAFMEILRLARARFADSDAAMIGRADVASLDLEPADERALSEILLREAPFVGTGSGGPDDLWTRPVDGSVVRFWGAETPEDYLAARADQLRASPQLGWTPVVFDSRPAAASGPNETANAAEPARQIQPGLRVGFGTLVALAGIVPFVLGLPLWVIGAVVGASAGVGAVCWSGVPSAFEVRHAVIVCALTAAGVLLVSAGLAVADRNADSRQAAKPLSRAERVVRQYVADTREKLDWRHPPTVYDASVRAFVRRFDDFDPQRAHPPGGMPVWVDSDVFSVAQRSSEFAGAPLKVTGRLAQPPMNIATLPAVSTWALFLRDPGIPRVVAICRVPLAHGDESALEQGDTVEVVGLLLAEGAIERLDGRGSMRATYLACASAEPARPATPPANP